MDEKYLLSEDRIAELRQELKKLEVKGRREITKRYENALRENNGELEAPFLSITEDKYYLEKRISELQEILKNAQVLKKGQNHSVIEIGDVVKVGFETFEATYYIVSPLEADPLKNKISTESPVGKALLGLRVGDKVIVKLPGLAREYRVLNIE